MSTLHVESGGGAIVAEKVYAEMVANVLSISVAAGDTVEPGTILLLLESMKMEIPVLCEAGGTVAEVKVEPGDVVQEGDLLVVVA
jgi:acetyl-CoA carboxylase biotin carboxyl carrier protein